MIFTKNLNFSTPWSTFGRSSAKAIELVKAYSQKLFSYEFRCSSINSNHFHGLEIDRNASVWPLSTHNKTKRVTRFFEKLVRDINLESRSVPHNVRWTINLKKNQLSILIRDRSMYVSNISIFLRLRYTSCCNQSISPIGKIIQSFV